MEHIIREVIEKVFEKIPFSKQEELLKDDVRSGILEQYEKNIEKSEETDDIQEGIQLIASCKDVQSACETAQCPVEHILEYTTTANVKTEKETKKILNKLYRYTYVQCLCIAMFFEIIVMTIFQSSFKVSLSNGIVGAFVGVLFLYTAKRKRKYWIEKDYENLRFAAPIRQLIYKSNDRYSKRLLNTMMFGIALVAYVIFSIVLSILTSLYTWKDVCQQIVYNSVIMEAVVYLILKNYMCKRITDTFFVLNRREVFKSHVRSLLRCSIAFFAIIIPVLCVLRNHTDYVVNWFLTLEIVYLIWCGSYNFIRRKKLVFHNIVVNKRRSALVVLLIVSVLAYNLMSMNLYLTQSYINTVSRISEQEDQIDYNEKNGVYTITTDKKNFKILQLTDIHLGGSLLSVTKDIKALEACYQLIKSTRPDLVVVTGDLVFPMGIMSFSFNNNAPIMQFANFMRNIGIPWAFTYGNHDTEVLATLDRSEFDALMKKLSYKSSGNLLYPYIQPDIYGRSNQMIEVRDTSGSLMQALFLLDSNDYISESSKLNEYDYIHDDQVDWYKDWVLSLSEEEGHTIPSMVFFHIPLREYKEANDLYEEGSNQVQYYYGMLGEKMIDKICCSKYESKLFHTAVELGSTKAMFCGHDHYNNQSLEYKGIRLTYGYSIDYLVMPGIDKDTEQRGATLITIEKDGSFVIEPVKLIDIE